MLLKIMYRISRIEGKKYEIGQPLALVAVEVALSNGTDPKGITLARSAMPLDKWAERVEAIKKMFAGRADVTIVDAKQDEDTGAIGLLCEHPVEEKEDGKLERPTNPERPPEGAV